VLGRIAGYELLELVGTGGMSHVFQSRASRLGSTVAVKVLFDSLARNPEFRERFFREARLMASLSHDAIAKCFDLGEATVDPPDLIPPDAPGIPPASSKLYLAMEFVHGSDLSALVTAEPIEIPRVLRLAEQIAAGLEAAHTAGVVHRDLKPANVRVTPDDHVKIVDFGLAAIIPRPDGDTDGLSTSHDHIMGTWPFMSPEQTYGRTIDPRSDLFSLGTILYLLVTGKLPFAGNTSGEVSDAIRHVEPPPMARYANHVPDELERIVRKLHAKDPKDRYQSAHEVRTDIERLRAVPPPPPVPPPPFLRALLVGLGAVLVLIGAVLLYLYYRPWQALAVVPFVNQTGDRRFDYLGDGMAAGVTALLINRSHLSLAASYSVQQIPPEKRTAKNLKHELGVDAIVAGSVVNNAGVLHLDLELVESQHGWVIWARGYDYDVSASDEMQRQIAWDLRDRLSRLSEHARTPPPRPTKSSVPLAQDLQLHATSVLEDSDNANGPEQALAALDRALKLDPDFALAWAWRSRALWRLWDLGRKEESLRLAEEAADRAVRLNPELLDARLARAQIYRAKGRYALAIRELTGVLAINPNWDDAEVHLAAAYRDSGAFALAEYHFRHATQVRPRYWRNWNSLGDVRYLRGDHVGAREAYRMVIRLAPERNIGYTRLAAVEIVDAHYDAAIELYDMLPKPVEDGDAMANMGVAYLFKRRLEDARRYLWRAAQLKPRDVDLWINLGDLHTRAERPDSARTCYERALQLADEQLHVVPRNRILQVQRIQCLGKVGDCDEVHAAFSARADTIASGNADLTHRLAKAYALCGMRAEALVAVKKAIQLGFSRTLMHDEDDFAALVSDPEFPK